MIARQVFYEGRVQGVGFRYTVKKLACGYEVTGWVRNLTDGRVEMQCCGEREEVETFVTAIIESELQSHIQNTTVLPIALLAGGKGFEIVR